MPQKPDFSPPFFAVNLAHLSARVDRFRTAFRRRFPSMEIAASYKTALLPGMLAHLHADGVLAEVVSAHEWAVARALGVEGPDIIVNGPGKSSAFLAEALKAGARVNLDDLSEVDKVVALVSEGFPAPATIGLRVALRLPDTPPPHQRSRFGLTTTDGQFATAVARLSAAGVPVTGVHMHLTTRLRRLDHFAHAAAEFTEAIGAVDRTELRWIDVGGGFGSLPPDWRPLDLPTFDAYADTLHDVLAARVPDLDDLTVFAEPGIALFGDAVEAWFPVLSVKQVEGRTVVLVDGSAQTIKPTRHGLNLPTRHLGADFTPRTGPNRPVDVVGYTCLEDDVLAVDLPLVDPVRPGDVLVIRNVGAYTWVFKPPFIRLLPPFVGWDGSSWRLLRPAERWQDVFPTLGSSR